jgi:DNA invertase Pin-like site-specific DNA recombinase
MPVKRTTPKPAAKRGPRGPAVWALLAVSSEQQSETLVHPRKWAEEAAASHGWHLTRVVEGVASGKEGPRRVVRELLADLRTIDPEARPARLLMIRADRVGRGSIIDSQIVLRDLRELGVSVWTRDQGEVKLDSTMDQLISAVTLAVAAHENDVRRDKAKQVRKRKREAGEPMGTAPYGLRYEGKKFAVDRERVAIVREAFKLRLQAKGYDAIGKRLTAIALPQVYLSGKSVIVHWTATRVSKLLSNRAYVGPIVDEATFARAQQIAQLLTNGSRNGDRRRHYPWPLAGSLKCYCGRVLIGMACGVEPWRYRYYTCKARWNHDGKLKLVRAECIEDQFVDLLGRLRASPKLIERYSRRAASLVSPRILERSIRDLKAKLGEIARRRDAAWELHASGKVRPEDVQERLDALADQSHELHGRLAGVQEQLSIAKVAANRERDVEALLRRAVQTFRKAAEDEQNQIARATSLELGGLAVDPSGRLQVIS